MPLSQFSRRQFPQTAAVTSAMAAASADRPNMVFLMADEHRHDALGCAGKPAVHSQNVGRMAAQGVRFERTYCQGLRASSRGRPS